MIGSAYLHPGISEERTAEAPVEGTTEGDTPIGTSFVLRFKNYENMVSL